MKKKFLLIVVWIFLIFLLNRVVFWQNYAKLIQLDKIIPNSYDFYYPILNGWEEFYKQTPNALKKAKEIEFYSNLFGIFILLLISLFINKNKSDTHGSASWGKLKEIKEIGYEDYKWQKDLINKIDNFPKGIKKILEFIILLPSPLENKARKRQGFTTNLCSKEGVFLGKLGRQELRDNEKTHIYLSAPTRTGKGVGIILNTLVEWKDSCIVLDIKGENYSMTSGYRAEVLKQKIYRWSPMNEESTAFNPLEEVKWMSITEFDDVYRISSLLTEDQQAKDPFWSLTAGSLLATIIIYLYYKNKSVTLADVFDFLTDPSSPFEVRINKILGNPDLLRSQIKDIEIEFDNLLEEEEEITDELIEYKNLKEKYEYYQSIFEKYRKTSLQLSEKIKIDIKNYLITKKSYLSFLTSIIYRRNENRKFLKNLMPEQILTEEEQLFLLSNYVNLSDIELIELGMHPMAARGFNSIVSTPENTRNTIIKSAESKINIFGTVANVRKATSKSDFKIIDLVDGDFPSTLYFVIEPKDISVLMPLFKIFLTQFIGKLTSEMKYEEKNGISKPVNFKHRCLLLLDEFPSIGKLEIFRNSIGFIAGYGLKALVVTQSTSQIQEIYGKDGAESIISNCSTQIYYTPNDNATATYISSRLGKKTIIYRTKSGSMPKLSYSHNFGSRSLLDADELMKLDMLKMIIFVAGMKPILAEKVFWFKTEKFKKRIGKYPSQFENKIVLYKKYNLNTGKYEEIFNERKY